MQRAHIEAQLNHYTPFWFQTLIEWEGDCDDTYHDCQWFKSKVPTFDDPDYEPYI